MFESDLSSYIIFLVFDRERNDCWKEDEESK